MGSSRTHAVPAGGARRPARTERSFLTTGMLVTLIVVAMGIVFVAPQLVDRRISELQARKDEAIVPARHHSALVGQALALEVAAIRGYALTGDRLYVRSFERALQVERVQMSRLRRILPLLGDAPVSALEQLQQDKAAWILPALEVMEGRAARDRHVEELSAQQDRFEAVLRDLRALDQSIVAASDAVDAQIAAEEDWGRRLVLVSGLSVLGAVLALTTVMQRLRRLARQLRYRAEEERALRLVARSLSAASSVREVVQQVVDSAVRTTRALGAYVEQAQEDHVTVLAVAGEAAPQLGTRVPYPGSLTQAVMDSGEPEILTEIGAIGESMAPYLSERCRGCSGLLVPLVAENAALGALVLLRSATQEGFTPAESAHARALGDLASAALRRVILLEETRREREALRASEQQFRSLAERVNAAVLVVSEDDEIVFANATVESVFGWPVAEIVGQSMTRLMPESHRGRHRQGVDRYLKTGVRNLNWESVQLPGLRKDGRVVPLEITMGDFVRDGRRYFTGIARDISERRRAEAERDELLARESRAREAFENAVRARDDVLAIVSHDLRNPLNTISLGLAMLPSLPPERRDIALATVRRAVGRMDRLIQDLLDVTRLETGRRLSLQPSEVELAALLGEARDAFRSEAETKKITITCEASADLPPVRADRDRAMQVLSNLIGNALKFTPEMGTVHLRARPEADAVQIEIEDSGPGIPETELSRVFDAYWQARRTSRLGAGLGLAISRGIVEAHGGRIWVESRPGHGSTFCFTLPVTGPRSEDEPAAETVAT